MYIYDFLFFLKTLAVRIEIATDHPIYSGVRTHIKNARLSQTQHQKSRAAFVFYSASTVPDKKERRDEKKRNSILSFPPSFFPLSFLPVRERLEKDKNGKLCRSG